MNTANLFRSFMKIDKLVQKSHKNMPPVTSEVS